MLKSAKMGEGKVKPDTLNLKISTISEELKKIENKFIERKSYISSDYSPTRLSKV